MNRPSRSYLTAGIILVVIVIVGQVLSYLFNPESWMAFIARLPTILSMVAFWGPIIALIVGLFVWATLSMLGFSSLEIIRKESVEQNNPAPAIILVGTLVASILFLMLVIRP